MSILDDAIREHLELKRAHGADEGEVKKLEDEAFGPPQRPDEIDPFAEAPTEFLLSPSEGPAGGPEVGDEAARSGRRPNITDLQEAPPPTPPEGTEVPAAPEGETPADAGSALFDADLAPPTDADAPAPAADEELSPAPDAPPPSPTDAADVPPPPPADEVPAEPEPITPADEQHPAGEHEVIADPGPTTEERHAIADQPTQMFDVQAHVEAEAAEAGAAERAPSDEELVDAAQSEPTSAPPVPDPADAAPPTEIHEQPPLATRGPDAEVAGHPPAEEESAEFDFFNEQRLSDELDQALEAPLPPTDEHGLPQYEDAPPAQGGIFDIESEGRAYEEDPSEEVLRRMDEPPSEEAPHAAEPPSEEIPYAFDPPSEERPRDRAPEPPSEEAPPASAEPPSEESDIDYDPDTGHEDVLEDTPRFLEDAPEDDDLWFEQKPPKDFDLD